jgi:hypothetical protein
VSRVTCASCEVRDKSSSPLVAVVAVDVSSEREECQCVESRESAEWRETVSVEV